VYEAATGWYERYQSMLEMAEDLSGLSFDEPGPDDEP